MYSTCNLFLFHLCVNILYLLCCNKELKKIFKSIWNLLKQYTEENTLIRKDTYHQFFHVANLNLDCMKPELRRLIICFMGCTWTCKHS